MGLGPSQGNLKEELGRKYVDVIDARGVCRNASGREDAEYSVDFLGDCACVVMTKTDVPRWSVGMKGRVEGIGSV